MGWLDRLFTRRRLPRFADVSDGTRLRLAGACQELGEDEDRVAARLGLASPPRLLLVDEETAVIILPEQREEIAGLAKRRS
ncbi:hypothetical protein [Ramlibacter rhizophilus]|uniref:Uncharacterized protein n=1 Tax=Ramlibacter rhizophilus TaxID=1781167 RepID=A0A4Z0BW17_9BURK|nr:hypothetical protein [Ramlibacter rhizophilus]TFZ03423.1 hypothetical protein EZ242_05950 [Ramlibacter rhizophilus]